MGNVDAHVTAPAAQAIEPGHMLAVMGTSTCHVMNGDRLAEVPGMCGVVDGGITPGFSATRRDRAASAISSAGSSSSRSLRIPREAERRGLDVHRYLSELASAQAVGQHGLVGLDWHSGNRSVLVDHELSGVLVGATLSTRPEDIYRALIEATAFGTRTIIDSFESHDVPVRELTVAGGLLKNPLVMQIYADVLRRPLHMIESEEGPALGAAMHAAVAAGIHPEITTASAAMGKVRRNAYRAEREKRRRLRSAVRALLGPPRLLRPRHADARAAPAAADHASQRRTRLSPTCVVSSAISTPSSRSTGSSSGRAGISRRASPGRS